MIASQLTARLPLGNVVTSIALVGWGTLRFAYAASILSIMILRPMAPSFLPPLGPGTFPYQI